MLIRGATLFVIVETLNILLLIALFKGKKKLNLINKLFIYLTCIDIISFILFTTAIIRYTTHIPTLFQLISLTLSPVVQTLDIFTFSTISFLRYWSLKHPFQPINTRMVYCTLGGELVLVILLFAGTTISAMCLSFEIFIALIQWATTSIISLTLVFIVIVNTMSYVRLLKIRKTKKT